MSMFWTFTWVCSLIYSFTSFASFRNRIDLINNPDVQEAAEAIFFLLLLLSVLITLAFPILYILSSFATWEGAFNPSLPTKSWPKGFTQTGLEKCFLPPLHSHRR
jgi:hypothetical protein